MLIHLRDRDVDRWTLRQVLEHGILAFECRKCWHLAQLDVLDLVGRFGPEMPAILITADQDPRLRTQARAQGIAVLSKPVKPAALRALLAQWRAHRVVAAE